MLASKLLFAVDWQISRDHFQDMYTVPSFPGINSLSRFVLYHAFGSVEFLGKWDRPTV